jgi:hypothetical protein
VIVFERSGETAVRRGEFTPLPGVRSRLRAVPYPGCKPPGADPWRGEYARPAEEQRIGVGSDATEDWIRALSGAPAGCILVGPVPPEERIYGAAAAAVSAALDSGRGAVLLGALDPAVPGRDEAVTAVEIWRSGEEETLWEGLRSLRGRAVAGVVLPLLPGWTTEEPFLESFLSRARREGARFVAPLEVNATGASRAAILDDFAAQFPDKADAYFGRLYHADWAADIAEAKKAFFRIAASLGLESRAPAPRGRADFPANLRAIEALDRRADESPEPEAARLRRAVRSIEDLGRDLQKVAEDGNVRLLFPPESPEGKLVEGLLLPSSRIRP